MDNELFQQAVSRYYELKEKVRQQEDESDDIEIFGGVDDQLAEDFGLAKSRLQEFISPDEYFQLKEKVAHLRGEIGSLILENMVLKSEVRRLGGNPDLLGNTASGGNS